MARFTDFQADRFSMHVRTLLTVRHLRLISGLVMFLYLATHLFNHALGIVSLRLAETVLAGAMVVWRNPVVTAVLYGAALVHFVLALWTLFSRREWHLPFIEILRLAAGFSFPVLLIGHAVTARLGDTFYDFRPSYETTIASLIAAGAQGTQLALLAPGWLHGCLGLWIYLRRSEAMQRMKPVLIALVIVVPLAAAIGFARMAMEVTALGPRPPAAPDDLAKIAVLRDWGSQAKQGYLLLIAAVFALGRARAFALRKTHHPAS
jgi:adenylate cyclase